MCPRFTGLVLIALSTMACADVRPPDSDGLSSQQPATDSLASNADIAGAALWMRGRERTPQRGRRREPCVEPTEPSSRPQSPPEPEEPDACLFGEQFSDLRSHEQLSIVDEHWITAVAQVPTALEREQLVVAVQQSSHVDVVTADEALARVDQQEIRRMDLHDAVGTPMFTVYEYGVGDNSYGAIFVYGSSELAANIHDGDLLNCVF